MILSFIFFLSIFAAIGLSSAFKSRYTKKDYYLASRSVSPALVGLSAVATNNSGYMFIGVIGYTYVTGLSSIWLMIGWIIGDYLSSLFIHARLHQASLRTKEVSYAGVLSSWDGKPKLLLQRIIAVVSILFLLAYASAQLVAGSKALEVLFEWPTWAGAVMGATLVLLYCFAGGIRASIWTDAAQSVVMIIAMAILLLVATQELGGATQAIEQMNQIPGFMNWFPADLAFSGLLGGIVFAVGWAFAGFSVIGQPHIMVRFMTLDNKSNIYQARIWYYLWFTAFYLMATLVGMLSRIYLGDTTNFDAELALPTMAMELLPPVMVGLVLAGIFAATMSTADSLILSCSSALTHDLIRHSQESMLVVRLGTFVVTLFALALALMNEESVFNLVILSWSGLASAFAPLLIMLSLGVRINEKLAITAIAVGLSTAILWRYFGFNALIYEGMPGILMGLLALSPAIIKNSNHSA